MTPVTSVPSRGLSKKRHHRSIETRQKLIAAGLVEFAAHGFDATSTRTIAARAGVPSEALPYHFSAKEDLWRAAAERAFGDFHATFGTLLETTTGENAKERARRVLVEFVIFFAQRPELHRFMEHGAASACARLDWLITTHIRPMHKIFAAIINDLETAGVNVPTGREHLFYMFLGAATAPYALARDFEISQGVSPFDPDVIARHADAVITAFLPEL